MRLRVWAHSTERDGARSPAHCIFLDGLLRRGSVATMPDTISVDQATAHDIPCVQIHFRLPRLCQSSGVSSIPVLIPSSSVGTGNVQLEVVFCALLEEIIGWLAGVGPKNTLVRLFGNN